VLLGLTLAGASLAWGQTGRGFGGDGFQDRFLEVKRTQLGPALGVSQPTVDKLLAIDARYKPLRHQMVTGMKSDMSRLQQLMNQPSPPEGEVKRLLADMKRKRLEMLNLQQRKDDEESSLLTPMQQARYLMYLMSLIKEARSVKSDAGKSGHGRSGVVGGPCTLGAPAGMPVPTLRPSEIPVSSPPR